MLNHGKREAQERKRRWMFHAIWYGNPTRYDLARLAIDVARNPYAWPGGYVRGLVMDDGGILCPRCVRDNIWEIAHDTRHAGWHGTGWVAAGTLHAAEVDNPHDEICSHCDAEMVIW